MYLIQPLTYPFYPPYVSTLSPQSLWITAERVDKSVKKRFSHQEVGKSSEKRGFYISFPKKNVYFALCHTLHHYGPLWIIFALRCVHAVYIIIIFPYCISSATIFPISTIFSPSFFGFSSAIFFSISIYCGFTSFYHYVALVVPFCTWLCFFLFSFALLMWKSLFSADNSFFVTQLYIGISPIILFKNLTPFMCRNLLVRHYYLSCLCLYSLSLCKNKYVS